MDCSAFATLVLHQQAKAVSSVRDFSGALLGVFEVNLYKLVVLNMHPCTGNFVCPHQQFSCCSKCHGLCSAAMHSHLAQNSLQTLWVKPVQAFEMLDSLRGF